MPPRHELSRLTFNGTQIIYKVPKTVFFSLDLRVIPHAQTNYAILEEANELFVMTVCLLNLSCIHRLRLVKWSFVY